MSKLRISLAAMLALVAVLALGPASVSSAPGENAVVHWSGVAETAIAAGRPPASSTVLAAMVHGAMYDAVAAALFLAERTVASHLTRVYAKLGVRSRTELAHRLGEVPQPTPQS